MGGLKKYLPITYWTSLIGTLALIGAPGLAGFFSKDAIIEAVHASTIPGAGFAYAAVLIGVFVTALYSFRLLFLVFHGKERFDAHGHPPHESPAVVTVPLILLAIPSVLAGYLIGQMVFGDWLADSIFVMPQHDVLAQIDYHGVWGFLLHGLQMPPFWLALAGVVTAWFLYIKRPDLPGKIQQNAMWLWRFMDNKYCFDSFNDKVFAGGSRGLGGLLWKIGDAKLIDGLVVNGSARLIGLVARVGRQVQSGYLYHYAFAMMIGVWLLLTWFVG